MVATEASSNLKDLINQWQDQLILTITPLLTTEAVETITLEHTTSCSVNSSMHRGSWNSKRCLVPIRSLSLHTFKLRTLYEIPLETLSESAVQNGNLQDFRFMLACWASPPQHAPFRTLQLMLSHLFIPSNLYNSSSNPYYHVRTASTCVVITH